MRSVNAWLVSLALAAASGAGAGPSMTVTARGLASVEIDAGSDRGLAPGDRLRVLLAGSRSAEMEVVRVDARTAACRVLGTPGAIQPGDVVVPAAHAVAGATPPVHTNGGTAQAMSQRQKNGGPAPSSVASRHSNGGSAASPVAAAPSLAAPISAPAPIPAAAATPAPSPATATAAATPAPRVSLPFRAQSYRVKHRSATSVYLDGGKAQGLAVGDGLEIVDGRTSVATLEVGHAAEQSSSCKVVLEKRAIREGDMAGVVSRMAPAAAQVAAAAGNAATSGASSPPPSLVSPGAAAPPGGGDRLRGPWARLRGTASFGYYRSWDGTESALDYEQRTARLDLSLHSIAGMPWTFTVRGRSREDIRARTLSTRTPRHERTDRLYEVSLRYDPPSERVGLEVGRIASYRLGWIGYLDGGLAHVLLLPVVHVGVFAGRTPEIESWGDPGGRKLGGFLRLAPGGRYAAGWYDATVAFVREEAEGDVSREYLSLESRLGSGSRFSLFQRAELDLNRGWRQQASGSTAQLSNVSLSMNVRANSWSWAYLSYDGRRNYRYFLNRLVPEELFDDLLHQGLRAGLSLAKPGGFGASAGFGMSLKEEDPRHPELNLANATSFNAGVRHADLLGFSAGIDGSGFSNGYTEGALVSARLGRRLGAGHMFDLSYGRSLYRLRSTDEERTTEWLRLVGRAELGRRLFLLGDFEYDAGDDLRGPRGFLELGVVF